MKAPIQIALASIAATLFAPLSHAGWDKTTDVFIPDQPSPLIKSATFSYGNVSVFSTGGKAFGKGSAFDSAPGTDVRLEQSAHTNHLEKWTYTPPEGQSGHGRAQFQGVGSIEVSLSLDDPACSAASAGYTAVMCSLLDKPVQLEKSLAKETGPDGDLGEITLTYEAISWSKTISFTTGTGEFTGSENKTVESDKVCTNSFTIDRESEVAIKVFADDWLLPGNGAKVSSDFLAKWTGKVILGSCDGGSPPQIGFEDSPPPGGRGDTPPPGTGGKGRNPSGPTYPEHKAKRTDGGGLLPKVGFES